MPPTNGPFVTSRGTEQLAQIDEQDDRLVSASVSVAIAFGVAIGSVIVNATFNRQGVGVSGRRYPASASTRVAVPKAASMMSASGTAGTTEAGWLSSAGHNAVTLAILPHVWLDEISKINLDGKTFLTYSYNQRKGVDGLQFVLEVSEDMTTWNSGEEYLKSIEDDKELKSEFYRRSFRSVKPVNLNQSYFFRLKIVSE